MHRQTTASTTEYRKIDIYGTAAVLGSVVCWGSVPVLLRELTDSVDAWTANAVRYPLSALLYWPVLFITWRSGTLNRQVIARCAIPAALALSGQVFWALAPYYLTASSIGFFVRMSLVWSLLAAMILFADERRLLRVPGFYLGLLLAIGGFVVLSVSRGLLDASVTLTGVAIIFTCSLFFGLYAVSVRKCLRGIHPLIGFGVVSQFVSIGTLTAGAMFGQLEDLLSLSTTSWCQLVSSSILGIAFGHFFLYVGVGRLGAAIPAGVAAVTPLVTAALAIVFLGESLTTFQWVAGTGMMLGAVVLLRTQQVVVVASHGTESLDEKAACGEAGE